MNQIQLKNRTKKFSIDIIDLIEKLPNNYAGRNIANQLVRSATSVGANYRAVCRARSKKEFIAKMHIVIEEADECCFWLELITEKAWIDVGNLLNEANELTAIFVKSNATIRRKKVVKEDDQYFL
jgi:four helix bundle protein